MLANSALMLQREVYEVELFVPGVIAVTIAVLAASIGLQRRAVLRRWPLPVQLAATTQVWILGCSVVALTIVGLATIIAS